MARTAASAPAPSVNTTSAATASAAVQIEQADSASEPSIHAGPVKIQERTVKRVVAGKGAKKCAYSITYAEISSRDSLLDDAVNEKLRPSANDTACSDDSEWSGDNGLSGRGGPRPDALEYTGNYQVHYNANDLLAVTVDLAVDIGMARGVVLRHDVLVLDLARSGRIVPLSEVVDRKKNTEGWAKVVGEGVGAGLKGNMDAFDVVMAVTVDTDIYVLSDKGLVLRPGYLPQAFDALGARDYTVTWKALAPFWIPRNPIERARTHG
jgi:hypothetical protein